MRITFLVERPTQFEAPFFRYAARDGRHQLRVLFTGANLAKPAFDPELGHTVSWDVDLLGGFPHSVAPLRGRVGWLARELRRDSCDLLIANGYTRAEYLLAAMLARRAGIATALRLDSVLWNSSKTRRQAKRLLFSGLLMRLFDLFLGVGSLSLGYLAACGVPAERRGLFPYAIDVEHFRDRSCLSLEERTLVRGRLKFPPSARVVLAVAKLISREAPWDLLRALPHLAPEVRLLLVGDGPDRPGLEATANELGPGRVVFLGYVPYAELPALYAAADLFVHPAREERWGVSVAEALACGLPVLASSRVGAGYDLLLAGRNGWQYTTGDEVELARRIEDALALDQREVAAASNEVLSHWNYAATWRHLIDAGRRSERGSVP
ncbi:MAG TPA: glycosyltransferase [Thermoanaerobaculia bacterium]|nr:glycosyltransferase [Thermoanaerobaculia bacterium]